MLSSIKDKLITNVAKISLLNSTAYPNKTDQNVSVDLYAGADILSHFQSSWAELHEMNECNTKSAAILGENISRMHETVANDHTNIIKIVTLLNSPPKINICIENCFDQVRNLHDSFQIVEKGLADLEAVVTELDYRNAKANYINTLILHRKKELADAAAQSILEEEAKQKKLASERQQVFEEAFTSDLETYKTLGAIPKIETKTQPSALLEEIQLDLDEKELETFLNDK